VTSSVRDDRVGPARVLERDAGPARPSRREPWRRRTASAAFGWLDFTSRGDNLQTFERALTARGWIKGKTFTLEYRGGEGRARGLQP
jgi:hypothetical protein